MSTDKGSVSGWIAGLKTGDQEAANRLWTRFSSRLVELARQRLAGIPKGAADEEDIAQNVFHSLCRGAALNRFEDLQDRDDLWWLLLKLTKDKAVDQIRRESALKRGGGRTQHESSLASEGATGIEFTLDMLIGDDPTPDFLFMLDEEQQRLLNLLRDDKLRKIAVSRIEGRTVPEIAGQLAVSTRTVERKLELIRDRWSQELTRSP
jgi:RNA polymerase sigma factor (sigma-70 family)